MAKETNDYQNPVNHNQDAMELLSSTTQGNLIKVEDLKAWGLSEDQIKKLWIEAE